MQNSVVVLGVPDSWAEEWAGGARLCVNKSMFSMEHPISSDHGIPWLAFLKAVPFGVMWLCPSGVSTARAASGSAGAVSEPTPAVLLPCPGISWHCWSLGHQGPPDQHSRIWGAEMAGQHGGVSLPLALCAQKGSTSHGQNRKCCCIASILIL